MFSYIFIKAIDVIDEPIIAIKNRPCMNNIKAKDNI